MTPRSTSSNLIPTRQRTRPLVTTRAAVSPGEVIHRGAPAATVVLPRIPWGSRPSRRRCRALTVRREEPSRTFPMSDPCVPQEALPRSRPGDDDPAVRLLDESPLGEITGRRRRLEHLDPRGRPPVSEVAIPAPQQLDVLVGDRHSLRAVCDHPGL